MPRPRVLCATLCFVALVSSAAAQSYRWSALAGLPPQVGSADGVAGNARFRWPAAVCADVAGNVYVCDGLNGTIRRVDPNGFVNTLAGTPGVLGYADGFGPNARFGGLAGITIANGALFVTDELNHSIRRVSGAGVVTTFAGKSGQAGSDDGDLSTARFDAPHGIISDANGNLYISDRLGQTVRKITPAGIVTTLAGQPGVSGATDGVGAAARFNQPAGIALTSDGQIYVADYANHTVRKIAVDGTVSTVAGAPGIQGAVNGSGSNARFRYPIDVLPFLDGTVVVADSSNSCLRLISAAGAVSLYAGRLNVEGYRDGALTDARFFVPFDLCATVDGGIAIADTYNNSIRKISPVGIVSTLAGGGGNFGQQDGIGPAALFNYPSGVAVHSSGDIYLADSRGNTIRRISPDGTVVTVLGHGTNAYVDGPAPVASTNYPFGLAVAPDRTVYFCEQQMHTIRVLSPDGSVTTLAGSQGLIGSTDGTGTAARFAYPSSIARDAQGNLFIADSSNHAIRRIAAGTTVVTTFAGAAGLAGSSDGAGAAARFNFPEGVAVDAAGNVYVADAGNDTVRRITPEGVVSTIAGAAGVSGSTDGDVAVARFFGPLGIAVDASGRIFVADASNHTIRRIAGNTVTTIGGSSLLSWREGLGTAARFFRPNSIAVDASGVLFFSDSGNNLVAKGEPELLPVIALAPESRTVAAGAAATFTVGANGAGLTFQWRFNGTPIPGATSNTYTIANAQASAAGEYTVEVTNSAGAVVSPAATLTIGAAGVGAWLSNLSVLTSIDSPGDSFTLGYVVGGGGAGAKPLVIRAAGPALGALGVPNTLSDPQLELFADATRTGSNNDWGGGATVRDAMAAVGAFAFGAGTSRDAATLASISTRNNSVKVSGVGDATGTVIAEIYDATPPNAFTLDTPRLLNVSVLKNIGAKLTAGFVVAGTGTKRVLVRAIGPTLGAPPFGVPGVVLDPQITLFGANAVKLGENNDWGGTTTLTAAFSAVGAFGLQTTSKDAALVATLSPGNYSVEVTGVGGATGVALVEIYEIP